MECFILGQPLSISSDDEGALNSKKLQVFFKEEGITHVITKTHANQAERMIRDGQKNDWGQIEALQNQNMGGSAKALNIAKSPFLRVNRPGVSTQPTARSPNAR